MTDTNTTADTKPTVAELHELLTGDMWKPAVTPTVKEEAQRLLGYWERHKENPEAVAKWVVSDLMDFLRLFAEGD